MQMASYTSNRDVKSSGYISGKLNDTNNLLEEENRCLRSQLALLKENSDLKSATLISILSSWISGKRLQISCEDTDKSCCPQKNIPTNGFENCCGKSRKQEDISCECTLPQPIINLEQTSCDPPSFPAGSSYQQFIPKMHSTPKKNAQKSEQHNVYSDPRRQTGESTSIDASLPSLQLYDSHPPPSNTSGVGSSTSDQIYMSSIVRQRELKSRILGEIAFQLDRRIVSYVFRPTSDQHFRRRFYGYSLLTMATLLDIEADGDLELRHHFIERLRKLVTFLSPHGFDIEYHPARLVSTVNKFGRLNIMNRSPETTEPFLDGENFNELLSGLQLEQIERIDMLIFLSCLKAMSSADKLQLFVF
ncbi:speriolin-like [Anneissia japonica]|uniref:speriolin-like n=1 Tax=Anneissia japonica TaxID=1529436 RepID=UPI001425B7C0|nr:speriolin-like [Anneissia japonica]